MSKKIKIKKQKNYSLEKIDFDKRILEDALISNHSEIETNDYYLIVANNVKKEVFEHISWGIDSEGNQVEQGGIILGKIIQDAKSLINYGIAIKAIPAFDTDSSMKHLHFNHQVWNNILRKSDEFIEDNSKSNLQLIAWYHTHPKHLRVYMSDTDKKTQKLFFNQDWHFALIFNPQKKIWRVFQGKDARECQAYMIKKDYNEEI